MCVMFADKSSTRLPPSMPPPCFSSSILLLFLSLPPAHSALNNKYERVLREYPEGAISGVQVRAPRTSPLAHSETRTPPPPSPLPDFFGFFHDPKRESNTLRDETRTAPRLWKKGEGPNDRFMETAASFLSSLSFLFFSLFSYVFLSFFFFLNSSGACGRRINDRPA